jgi:ribosomal protein S18 acetylase RimI-like enzyme
MRLYIEAKLMQALRMVGINGITLTDQPYKLQTLLDSVPDFFQARQGSVAASDEAEKIINTYPQGISKDEKILIGLEKQYLIGFFEVILNFPNEDILASESNEIKRLLGDLLAKRFTISYIVLHTNIRKHGIGSLILATIEKVLASFDYHYAHLVVNERNKPARALYEKYHYQTIKSDMQIIGNKTNRSYIMIKDVAM